jgi:hypothetical protein
MNRMTPDLARLLVDERLEEAALRRRRTTARPSPKAAVKVPQQRRGSGVLARIARRRGVDVPTD